MVCFMLFFEISLYIARTDHPDDYSLIKDTDEIRNLALKLWDRAMCALEETIDTDNLGYEDDIIIPHVMDDQWLNEIVLLRANP